MEQQTNILQQTNHWIWVLLALGIILLISGYLFLRKRKKPTEEDLTKKKLKEEYRHPTVQMDNIVNDIFNSKPLYEALARKCHPDKFPKDEQKQAIATRLMQEITKNKTNTKRLEELKEQAEKELGIQIS